MFPEYTTLNVLLVSGLVLFFSAVNPSHVVWRATALLTLFVVQIAYAFWRFNSTLLPFEWQAPVMWQYLFFITEMIVTAYVLWQCITLIVHLDRTGQITHDTPKKKNASTVDLFIPTVSEPDDLLRDTITAAKKDLYPNLTIWICDDGARDWLRTLCKKMDVQYLRRPSNNLPRNKAGNLHWSIPHGNAEFIVCIDADFQAEPQMTSNLTCLFEDNTIGLVQAPQHFRNLDPIQRNLLGGKSWTEEQRFFFDIALPSRDAWNNTLCVGSCWATRREIVKKLGGYPTDSIVEDVYYGYCVKSLGWKTAYLNKKLATGMAAIDAPSYIKQRNRWCRGAMALLTARHGPIKAKRLSFIDRLFYLDITFYWFTHLHLLLLLIAPSLYGFFGFIVFKCTTEELMSILVPKSILFAAVFYWLSQGRCMPIITQTQKTLSVFAVISGIFSGLINPKYAGFSVTAKRTTIKHRTIHWNVAAPFILIGVITVLSIIYMQTQNLGHFNWSDYTVFNTVLSTYTLVTILLCCLVCVDKSKYHHSTKEDIPLQGSILKTAAALTNRTFL